MFYFDMIGTSEMPVCHSQGLKKILCSLANFFYCFFFMLGECQGPFLGISFISRLILLIMCVVK